MRLFVAIDFPDSIKDRLAAMQARIPGARWSGHHQLHLTLFFIGETDRVDSVQHALAGVQAQPFPLVLKGVGTFPSGDGRPPSVLWVGLEAPPALRVLQQRVSEVLVNEGYTPDKRPFNPHVTLARLKPADHQQQVAAFLRQHHEFEAGPVAVSDFVLYASELTPQGARYTRQAIYPLHDRK
ncbi:MAG: RNA 2',3'-cyclic phosphodiesterase [Anaerolineaceae bacterium]|nr:RNA 2',3'-cyclic phosphodiesterase [Anaerolineaceae bacterium]